MQTFEGRAFQTGETARAKALRQEHKLGGLPEHTAGDTAGVQSVPSTLYSSHPLTSELEDPSDTQGPAMEDTEGLEGRGLPTALKRVTAKVQIRMQISQLPGQYLSTLQQRSASCFCKEPDSKYFTLGGPDML